MEPCLGRGDLELDENDGLALGCTAMHGGGERSSRLRIGSGVCIELLTEQNAGRCMQRVALAGGPAATGLARSYAWGVPSAEMRQGVCMAVLDELSREEEVGIVA